MLRLAREMLVSRRPRRQTLKSACSRGGCSWRHPLNHNPASLPSPRRRPHHTWSLHAREESRSSTTIMATTFVDLQVCTTPESSSPSSSSSSAACWRQPRPSSSSSSSPAPRRRLPRHRPHPPVIYKEPESATAPAPNRGQEASQGSEEKPWRPCSSPEMRQGVTWSIYDQLLRRPPSSRCTSHMVPHPAERRPHHHRQLLRLARQRSGDPIIIDGYLGLLASGAVTPPSSTATSACSPAEW